MTLKEFIETKDIKVADDNLIDELWNSNLATREKVVLSLELNDLTPSYSTLTNMWFNYGLTKDVNEECTNMIFSKYQFQLSNVTEDLSATTEYSLYFDIFEDPDRNRDAWEYFLQHNPTKKFTKIMLANSGPVPFDLKHKLYEALLTDEDYHLDIYVSIRHSCFDNCGQVDRVKARDILYKLNLDDKLEEINMRGNCHKFSDVAQFLKD